MTFLARITVLATRGSAPRDAGAAMLVWPEGQSGTIGGGALEFAALARARALRPGETARWRVALGPALGQCCGGSVELLAEGLSTTPPEATAPAALPDPAAPSGPLPPLWLYGAGHVGRAVVDLAAARHGPGITWVDFARMRFPAEIPPGVTMLVAADPARAASYAPDDAVHVVMTHSHALDLAICHAVLSRASGGLHLIGSATKAARFRARLTGLGHASHALNRLICPLGIKALGKEPQAIALGLLLTLTQSRDRAQNAA